MKRQVVVCFRMPTTGLVVRGPQRYLERARALGRRAEALGAQLVAWGANTIGFAWDTDSVEEAVSLAVTAREDALFAGPKWAAGVAEGDMEALSAVRAELAWGAPLVTALALSRLAEPGEVLVDASLEALTRGELSLLGERVGEELGATLRGARLDTQSPWLSVGSTPSAAPSDGALADEADDEPLGDDADPEEFAARMVELTRSALLAGNAKSLQRLSEGLRATGEHEALADRMKAMARLSRGQIGEALRSLRKSRMLAEAEPPTVRCQASLALAFALSLAARPDDALLEGLDALARARESGDRKAQGACLAFLAKLFARVGEHDGASRLSSVLTSYPRSPSSASIEMPAVKLPAR